ncbi:hypothetical protein PGB90_008425 [Kerria lacca]
MTPLSTSISAQNAKDAKEGENVTLECRFSAEITTPETTFYWLRTNKKSQDMAAIKATPLDPGYELDFRPDQGRYDLHISNASYERDNGKYECRLKAAGSGRDLHSQSFVVTVLTPPEPPRISPSPNPTATEGKPFELTCSSSGGSPEPVIRWFREGQQEITDSVTRSTSRDSVTSAVLNLKPSRTDDGAIYRCIVWNRAMPEGKKLDTKVTLGVNYYPRVEIGPDNPVRVEKEGSVTLQCNVDAKPRVSNVRWTRNERFISTSFTHTINRVTMQDAGKYICTADNGLGQVGEAELTLDVQYPPQVTIEVQGNARQIEAEEGESVNIQCNVSANPPPITVEWFREGKPEFRQQGDVLKIYRVNADSAGTYTCRAVNILTPTSLLKQRTNRIGNASVTLLVRHRPGQARITPEKPVATEGTGVTLTCAATPPGWPMPEYRWWREGDELNPSSSISVLATGSKYTIQSVHLSNEGKYHCQATNELGHGETAFIMLTVNQPPKFITKLQPHVTRKDGDYEFSVMCAAQGKPKPIIKWLKGGKDISSKLFDTITDESESSNGIHTVQSTLRFSGRDRPNGNQLMPMDSGLFSCIFENDVKKAESSMNLRVEHGPIVLHKYNKVAYDIHETAEVVCQVQAYPRPEFQWSFSTNGATLMAGSDGHYEINTTVNESGGDIFTSVLQISNIREPDYGEYHCRVYNTVGNTRATIRLQPKGAPERPEFLNALTIGHNYVTLQWTPGFDGGIQNTKYSIAYRQIIKNIDNEMENNCKVSKRSGNGGDSWFEFDCQKNNPCNVTTLDQLQTYTFKVKAYNNKGHSNYSDEITAVTMVDRIPAPQRVTFDPESHTLSIYVGATCLELVGKVETLITHIHDATWQKIETLDLNLSGNLETIKEATILSVIGRRHNNGRSLDESDFEASSDELVTEKVEDVRVRVRLCLTTDHDICGDYTEAEVGSSYIREASTIATPTLIAIVVSCIVFVLFIGLIFVFCRCKRAHVKKSKAKDYEMENSTVHPSIVQQPPPPYYSTTGLENKALEHSMDLVLDDTSKNALYGGHAYSPYATNRTHPNGNEWVNMGYMENSYSNSNNGGSVNSQDSLWQMKMASAASNANSITNDHAPRITDQVNHYGGYDPLTHGGYRTMDDYAHYPQLTSASPDYSNHTASHQDFTSIVDKRNRRDLRLESPYHDVNGLPNPYLEHQLIDNEENIKQQPGQHLSISFDESLESGFSTPNSRNRRIIREIIV